MKKSIPMPVVVTAIVVVVGLGVILIWKGVQGPPELPRAPITVGEEAVPAYMKDQMTPEMQKMIEEQTKKYGVEKGSASSESSQPSPGR